MGQFYLITTLKILSHTLVTMDLLDLTTLKATPAHWQDVRLQWFHMGSITQACNFAGDEEDPHHISNNLSLRATREFLLKHCESKIIDGQEYRALPVVGIPDPSHGRFKAHVKGFGPVLTEEGSIKPNKQGEYAPLHAAVMKSKIRGHIFHHLYEDVDMKTCQLSIMTQTYKAHGLPVHALSPILDGMLDGTLQIKGSRNEAKKLLNRLCNFGACDPSDPDVSTLWKKFSQQNLSNREHLLKIAPYDQVLAESIPRVRGRKGKDARRTAMSYIYFDSERRMTSAHVLLLEALGNEVGGTIHDGFLVRKDVGPPVTNEVLDQLQRDAKKVAGFDVRLVKKPMEPWDKLLQLPADYLLPIEELYPATDFHAGAAVVSAIALGTHSAVAQLVVATAEGRWVYSDKTWYVCDVQTGLWSIDSEALRLKRFISTHVHDEVMCVVQAFLKEEKQAAEAAEAAEDDDDEDSRSMRARKLAMRLMDQTFKRRVEEELREHLFDPKFKDLLDQTPKYSFPMQNGMLDTKRKVLRPYTRDDYMSEAGLMPYAYVPMDDWTPEQHARYKEWLGFFDRGCETSVLRFLLKRLAASLFEGTTCKGMLLWTDKPGHAGDSGKSMLLKAILKLAGRYSPGGVSSNFWNVNRNAGGNQHEEHLVAMRGKRFNGQDETRSTAVWDTSLIQRLCDVDVNIVARGCGDKTIAFPWTALNIVLCNHGQFPTDSVIDQENTLKRIWVVVFRARYLDPNSLPYREAIAAECPDVYPSKGDEFVTDMINGVHELFAILLDAYSWYLEEGLSVPDQIHRDRIVALSQQDACSNAIDEFFDRRVTHFDHEAAWQAASHDERRELHSENVTLPRLVSLFKEWVELESGIADQKDALRSNGKVKLSDRLKLKLKCMGYNIKAEHAPRITGSKTKKWPKQKQVCMGMRVLDKDKEEEEDITDSVS